MQATNTTETATGTHADPGRRRSPLVFGLAALLAAQIIAALLLWFGARDLAPAGSQGRLLAFDRDRITRIRIDAPGKESLTIERADGAWRIPGLGDFPASEYKVGELLGNLALIEKRLPVATSESAVKRFKLAPDDYERRVTLEGKDGQSATLYLGDSPGFRRLFVRAEGEQPVYEAELSLFDASEKPDDWSDKTYLHLEADEIQRIELPDAVLERKDGAWSLTDAKEGEELDEDAVNDSLRTLANVDYRGVLTSKDLPNDLHREPALTVGVKLISGEAREYRLHRTGDEQGWVLRVADEPYSFQLADYTAEALTAMNRKSLLVGTKALPGQDTEQEPVPEPDDGTASEPSDGPGPAEDEPPSPAQ